MRPSLDLLKDRKKLVGAEIGVADGGNAERILKNLDIKKLYLVDIWKKYKEEESILDSTASEANAKERLKDYKQVVFIKSPSVKAAKKITNKTLDFVYIDANHEYKFVKKDIEAWLPKVKVGGMIAGHDIDRPGVKQAVKEILNPTELMGVGPSDWYKYIE